MEPPNQYESVEFGEVFLNFSDNAPVFLLGQYAEYLPESSPHSAKGKQWDGRHVDLPWTRNHLSTLGFVWK